MKKRQTIYITIAVVLVLCTIGVGIYNMIKNSNFWNVNIAQVLTLFIAILLAFWATQFKNDQRRAKDHAERVIQKAQALVSSEQFYIFTPQGNIPESQKLHYLSVRKISNCIEVLKTYSTNFGFEEEIRYIEAEFTRYKDFVSEHLADYDYLSKSESQLRRHSENIDSKCDQIIVKLYK